MNAAYKILRALWDKAEAQIQQNEARMAENPECASGKIHAYEHMQTLIEKHLAEYE